MSGSTRGTGPTPTTITGVLTRSACAPARLAPACWRRPAVGRCSRRAAVMRRAEAPRPAVAVVVPAYDAASTLDETLRSVRGQTFHDLEIVVVDDGSTDATAEIAARHAEADPRVRLL